MRYRRDKDDGRVWRQARAGLSNQPVDLFEAKGLKTCRELSTQLIQRVATCVRGAAFAKLVFLADNAEHQHDDDGNRNQNRGEQKTGPACPSTAIRRPHRRILGLQHRRVVS